MANIIFSDINLRTGRPSVTIDNMYSLFEAEGVQFVREKLTNSDYGYLCLKFPHLLKPLPYLCRETRAEVKSLLRRHDFLGAYHHEEIMLAMKNRMWDEEEKQASEVQA